MHPFDYLEPINAEHDGKVEVESFVKVEAAKGSAWVSSFGRVFSGRFKRPLSIRPGRTGYVPTPFRWKNKGPPHFGTRSLHRVVAFYFCDPPANYPDLVVDHVNMVRNDNFFQNLEWVSPAENIKRALFLGALDTSDKRRSAWFTDNNFSSMEEAIEADNNRTLLAYREAHRGRIPDPDVILRLREAYEEGIPVQELFKRFHILPNTILRIVLGQQYKWVGATEGPRFGPQSMHRRAEVGESFARSIVTPSLVTDVLVLKRTKHFSHARIGSMLGISEGTVKLIAGGRHRLQLSGEAPVAPEGNLGHQGKVKPDLVLKIYKDYFWGKVKPYHLTQHYKLGAPTVYSIIRGEHWVHREGLVPAPEEWEGANPVPSGFVPEAGPVDKAPLTLKKPEASQAVVDWSGLTSFVQEQVEVSPHDQLDLWIPSRRTGFRFVDVLSCSALSGGKFRTVLDGQTSADPNPETKVFSVFSSEWMAKPELVKAVVAAKLHLPQRVVHGRRMAIRELSPSESSSFMAANHLQGNVGAAIRLGAFHEDELIAAMTFGAKRYGSGDDAWELRRYATKSGWRAVGAFAKLLRYFDRQHPNATVVSYADRRWSYGDVYRANGFALVRIAAPNYFYFRRSDQTDLKSRVQFQKHKLKSRLDTFDPQLSEWENMKANGWDRIWDCGNYVFERK